MDATNPILNRVAQSGLITLDLEDFFPKEDELAFLDLKDFLFKGLILREEEFRKTVKDTSWSSYQDKYVALHCSTDAIIPMWAYMILSAELVPYAKSVAVTKPGEAAENFLLRNILQMDVEGLKDNRVLVKGCGDRKIPEAAFVLIAERLTPVVRSLMYGEACSNVPVHKKSSK